MSNIHTPQRLENESFETYKARRAASKVRARQIATPEKFKTATGLVTPLAPKFRLTFAIPNYKASKIKNTKHTRAGSKKRKGAL